MVYHAARMASRPPDSEEAELVARVAAAGPDARAAERTFCERFGPRVVRYAQRHLRDRHAADDLTQEVMIVVLAAMRAGSVEQPDRLGSFVLSTCRHLVWDQNRAEVRRRRVPLEDTDATLEMPALRRLDVRSLERCARELPPRERSVVFLTYCEDWESEHIAGALGTTVGNVRVLRHRALARLAACVERSREAQRR